MLTLKRIKNEVFSIRFWGVVFLFIAVSFLADKNVFEFGTEEPSSITLMNALMRYSKQELAGLDTCLLAENIILSMSGYHWFEILFPVLVTFCGGMVYQEHRLSSIKRMELCRCSVIKYTLTHVMLSIWIAVLTLSFGLMLFSLSVFLLFPSGMFEGGTLSGDLLAWVQSFWNMYVNYLIQTVLEMLFVIFLLEIFRDIFYAVSVPMLINYTGYLLINLQNSLLVEKYGHDFSLNKYRVQMINPAYVLGADEMFPILFHLPFRYYAAGMSMLAFVMTILIMAWICKRIKQDEIR